MSARLLNDFEIGIWEQRRKSVATFHSQEIFEPVKTDIQLSEIRERLEKMQAITCECNTCKKLRVLIADIKKVER